MLLKYDDENLIKIVGVNNGEIVGWRMIFLIGK